MVYFVKSTFALWFDIGFTTGEKKKKKIIVDVVGDLKLIPKKLERKENSDSTKKKEN